MSLTSLVGFGGLLLLLPISCDGCGLSCFSTVAGVSTAAVTAHWVFIAADARERSAGRSSCQLALLVPLYSGEYLRVVLLSLPES